MGVAGLGRGQVGHVSGEVVAAPGAVMLGVGEPDVTRPAPHWVAQIMQGAGKDPIPRAGLAAFRTGPMLVIATARDELWGRKHLGIGDAQSGVRRVDCRTEHGIALLNERLFSLILRLLPGFVILEIPGGGAKVSIYYDLALTFSVNLSRGSERSSRYMIWLYS